MATKTGRVAKTAVKRPVAKRPVSGRTGPRRTATARKPPPAGAGRAVAKASGEVLRLAGIGTDAVAKATGRAWDEWLALLDQAGALAMPHKAIASMLSRKFGVPSWWSQMVTVGYEQARGLREVHEKSDGFAAGASRTLEASLERLFGAWADPALRALWLGDAPVAVKRSTGAKSMRLDWTRGGSSVVVHFNPVGERKSRVQVEHGRLADAKAVERQKRFWSGALERLKTLLEKAA